MENRPGGITDLNDLWPIMLRVYGILFSIVAVLVVCLWAINHMQHRVHPKRLQSAISMEHMEESVADIRERDAFDSWQSKEFYRDFE